MNLSNEYFNILKYIYKHPYITFSKLKSHIKNPQLESILYSLNNDKYIAVTSNSCKENDDGCETLDIVNDTHIRMTPVGDNEVETKISIDRKWKVPMFISLIALIKSFLPQIISALVLLSRLLKRL
jgi:hypothetical protein